MKTIAQKTAVFAQVVIFSIFLSGCSKSPERAIESVLNECATNTKKVNESFMSAADSARFLAAEMQKIDTRDCPPEFRAAFQQHINAWRDASGYFAKNTSLNSFLEGFAAGFLLDLSLLGTSERNAAIAAQNINTSYNNLVSIAASHGARVPESIVNP